MGGGGRDALAPGGISVLDTHRTILAKLSRIVTPPPCPDNVVTEGMSDDVKCTRNEFYPHSHRADPIGPGERILKWENQAACPSL